ncbi:hypothetical protein ILYODFUR_022866 [Ilyodon furcidens]|uniref:Uncharacterized protein n=1 Tax=Ilyodon furcidens TaxID=33524 RepID=A0ABV0TKT5_9TELE
MTPSCVSTPTNQRQVCIPPQPITFQGFGFKDLQPWISLLSRRASTLLYPIATIWLPSSLQLSYYRASTPSPVSDPGGEDISNPNPKSFIQAHVIHSIHVFLRGPSTKEISLCYLTSLISIFVFLLRVFTGLKLHFN